MFVAAEAQEYDGFLRHLAQVEKLSWPVRFARKAEMNGRPVVMLANGPGPVLAASAAREASGRLDKLDAFVSTGYCGALDGGLHLSSIVVASTVNGNIVQQPSTNDAFMAGPVLSRDAVICTVEEKSRLRKTGAIAVEMEAAGVETLARDLGVPFYCVRVVTDAASDALALDFNKVRRRDGGFSRGRIMAAACRNPLRIVPELLKFQRNCKSASIALGDFIANCRF